MTNELAEKQNQSLAVNNPWVVSDEDRQDIKFPRAKLFQGNPTEYEKYPNAKPGSIINHLTGEELPDTFIPFLRFKQYAKFNPRNSKDPNFDPNIEPGALIWVTSDSTDPRVAETKWGEHGEQPTAVEFMSFMCLFEGYEYPVILPFSKTSLSAGKKLFSMLVFSGGGYNRKYKLSVKKQVKDGNTYFVYDVNPAGLADEASTLKVKQLHAQFASKTSEVAAEMAE